MAGPRGPARPGILLKNMGFLLKNLPRAAKKSEDFFKQAIAGLRETGTDFVLGLAYLDMAGLYQAKKRTQQAREAYAQALEIFERLEIEFYANRAREGLAALGGAG